MIKWFCILFVALPRLIISDIKCHYYVKHKDKYSLEFRYAYVRRLIIFIDKLLRVTFKTTNTEVFNNNTSKQGRVFVSNHLGAFDVVGYIHLFENPVIFISKKENDKLPLIGVVMRCIDTILIDRDSLRQSLVVCKQAGKLVNEGRDVIIFAEGTRSKDGNVHEFKAALPALISYAKSDIIFVCLHNTKKALDAPLFKYPKVNAYYKAFETISYETYLENKKTFNEVYREKLQEQVELFRKEEN